MQHLYRPGHRYAKAGVMLMDLRPDTHQQLKLDNDTNPQNHQNAPQLMHAMDTLNDRFGRGTVRLASTGTPTQHRPWSMRQDRLTPGYTTDWEGMAWAG